MRNILSMIFWVLFITRNDPLSTVLMSRRDTNVKIRDKNSTMRIST